jgi:hypothetical protein
VDLISTNKTKKLPCFIDRFHYFLKSMGRGPIVERRPKHGEHNELLLSKFV